MKSLSLIILIWILVPLVSFGQTNVGGTITSDTEWTKEGSPYIISESLTLDSGVTLSVHPDVEIRGVRTTSDDWSDLTINGNLRITERDGISTIDINRLDIRIEAKTTYEYWNDYSWIRFDSVKLTTSRITIKYISNSAVVADENASGKELIKVSYTGFEIKNTVFDGMDKVSAALKLHLTSYYNDVYRYFKYQGVILNSTFINSQDGILLDGDTYYCTYIDLIFKYNSFYNINRYFINSILRNCISTDANQNYWGITDKSVIASRIKNNKSIYSGAITTEAPLFFPPSNPALLAPVNSLKVPQKDKILIGWEASSDPNVVGYRVYKRNATSYELVDDTGNETSLLTNLVDKSDTICITEYNDKADGTTDIQEGNESYYSSGVIDYLLSKSISIKSSSVCRDSVSLSITSSIEFRDREIILQLSDSQGSFRNPTTIQSIQNTAQPIASILPDTLKFGSPYKFRLLFGEIVSDSVEVTLHDNITSDFTSNEYFCYTYPGAHLTYTGNAPDNADFTWDFDDPQVVFGLNGQAQSYFRQGPYIVQWPNDEPKTVSLMVKKGACVSDTTFRSVKRVPLPAELDLIVSPVACPGQDFTFEYPGEVIPRVTAWWEVRVKGFDDIYFSGHGPHTIHISEAWPDSLNLKFQYTMENCYPWLTPKFMNIPISRIPDSPSIYKVTTESDSIYKVIWYYVPGTTTHFSIYHEEPIGTGTYQLLRTVNISEHSELIEGLKIFSITDSTNYTLPPRYKITALDGCIETALTDDYYQPIQLSVTQTNEGHLNLSWTEYHGQTDFSDYWVLRSLNGEPFSKFKMVPRSTQSLIDNTSTIYSNVAYQIEILIPAPLNSLKNGVFNSVRSNVVTRDILLSIINTNNQIKVHPNPTSDRVTIYMMPEIEGRYILYNLAGEEVGSDCLTSEFQIDLGNKSSGVYLLQIESNMGSTVKRIIKE